MQRENNVQNPWCRLLYLRRCSRSLPSHTSHVSCIPTETGRTAGCTSEVFLWATLNLLNQTLALRANNGSTTPQAHSVHRFPAPSSKLCQFSYLTSLKCPLFISAQLSTDAVSAHRQVCVLICRSNLAPKHARKHEAHPPRVKKNQQEFCLDSNDCIFICAGVNFVGGYKWHALFYLSCL